MTYLLTFDIDDEIIDIFVRVSRPVSFKTLLDMYILDKVILSRENEDNLMTKNLIGVTKLTKDFPWQYELTMEGELRFNQQVT